METILIAETGMSAVAFTILFVFSVLGLILAFAFAMAGLARTAEGDIRFHQRLFPNGYDHALQSLPNEWDDLFKPHDGG